jgi:uncharacterized protein
MKTIAINGSNGFLGSKIAEYFSQKYTILKIKRDDYNDSVRLAEVLHGVSIVVNLAGKGISPMASQRYQNIVYSSRIDTTKNLVEAIRLMNHPPELFVSFSAIGIYDAMNIHTEDSLSYGNDFLANLCKDWEKAAMENNTIVENTVIIRVGIVLDREGGMLSKMLLPFKLGLGTILGNGKQMLPFIDIDDFLRALDFTIVHKLRGIVNFAAPNYCSNYEFSRVLAKVMNRPLFFRVPSFFLKLVMGSQSSMLLNGQRVLPKVLLDKGFKFQYTDVNSSLFHLIAVH